MKIAIYTPYLDTVTGGEKYMLTIGECLSADHQVDVLLDSHLQTFNLEQVKEKIKKFHHLNLSRINFIPAPIGQDASVVKKGRFLKQYDWLFFNSDGSLFYSTARHSVLHFQLPLEHLAIGGLWGKIKLSSWQQAIYNSRFTKQYIERKLKITGQVIYPPVDVDQFKVVRKKKNILSVGRFAESDVKKQTVMIAVFKRLVKSGRANGWSLHLAGGAREEELSFLKQLINSAKGYQIYFHPNVELNKLVNLYAEASIYWHAMGYGEDHPINFEHFGISTVEAMASGAAPVAINKGGQPEIITSGSSGFLWDDLDQLIERTVELIEDPSIWQRMSHAAIDRSRQFSKQKFVKQIRAMVTS